MWEVELVLVRGRLGLAVVPVMVVALSGCAVASEERGGAGADGTPVVVVQCAQDAPDCDDTTVNHASSSSTVGDTTATAPSTAMAATTTATTTQPTELHTIGVAFTTGNGECDEVRVFDRRIDASRDPIVAAFQTLVSGPSGEEQASGADSFFSADTAGMVASAVVNDATLIVDLGDLRSVIPNASTTCGSMALLAQLNATAFLFDDVERVRYQIEGSCDTFANWLQRECMEYTRDGAQPVQP